MLTQPTLIKNSEFRPTFLHLENSTRSGTLRRQLLHMQLCVGGWATIPYTSASQFQGTHNSALGQDQSSQYNAREALSSVVLMQKLKCTVNLPLIIL